MTYITLEIKKKLDSVGFSFQDYERFLNVGMVYSYQEDEYIVGGFCNAEFSQTDKEVTSNGEWLPDSHQLFRWLQQCGFDVYEIPYSLAEVLAIVNLEPESVKTDLFAEANIRLEKRSKNLV